MYMQYGTSEFISILCSAGVTMTADSQTLYQDLRCLSPVSPRPERKGHVILLYKQMMTAASQTPNSAAE